MSSNPSTRAGIGWCNFALGNCPLLPWRSQKEKRRWICTQWFFTLLKEREWVACEWFAFVKSWSQLQLNILMSSGRNTFPPSSDSNWDDLACQWCRVFCWRFCCETSAFCGNQTQAQFDGVCHQPCSLQRCPSGPASCLELASCRLCEQLLGVPFQPPSSFCVSPQRGCLSKFDWWGCIQSEFFNQSLFDVEVQQQQGSCAGFQKKTTERGHMRLSRSRVIRKQVLFGKLAIVQSRKGQIQTQEFVFVVFWLDRLQFTFREIFGTFGWATLKPTLWKLHPFAQTKQRNLRRSQPGKQKKFTQLNLFAGCNSILMVVSKWNHPECSIVIVLISDSLTLQF